MTKNSFSIDLKKQIIFITKGFTKRAAMLNSEEYKLMRQWHEVFPSFEIRTKEVSSKKQTHKRLSLAFMERYINMRKECASDLIEFHAILDLYIGSPALYAKVKKWFLAKYPSYSDSIEFAEYVSATTAVEVPASTVSISEKAA